MFSRNTLILDLGSYEIKASLYNEKQNTYLTFKQSVTGIVNGYLNNVNLFQNAILNILKEIEVSCSINVKDIFLLLSGSLVEVKTMSSGNLNIQCVFDQSKISIIESKIKDWAKSNKMFLLEYVPIEFKLDNILFENPYGLYADTFSVKYFIFYASLNKINNIVYLLEKLGLNIVDIKPMISVLNDLYFLSEDSKLGSLVLDIGKDKIQWLYCLNKMPIKFGCCSLGFSIITNKIVETFKISYSEADKIQKEYVSFRMKPEHFCSWVKINRGSNEEYILQSELIRKVSNELDFIAAKIKEVLEEFSKLEVGNVAFAGGGSLTADFFDFFQKNSALHFKPILLNEFEEVAKNIIKKQCVNVSKSYFSILLDFLKHIFE